MKKDYQKPEYEIILLDGKNVVAGVSGWQPGEVPFPLTTPRSNSVWSDD